MSNSSTSKRTLALLVFSCIIILICAPFVGASMKWPIKSLLFGNGVEAEIFWRIRIPRVILGFLSGAALGGAGVVFQALFRNPLASPYTFGVASGASFGAACAIVFGWTGSLLGIYGISIGGVFGALLVTVFIYLVAANTLSGAYMLLAGVAMSFFFSSLLICIQYISNFTQSFQIVRWLMGGLETTGFSSILLLTPVVIPILILILSYHQELDAISTGEELAYSRGVNVKLTRKILFFSTSIMIGTVVSVTGPIGFVGIVIPHFCRMLFGPIHLRLIPCSLIASGCFLVACDAIARVILAPADLPVGIVTSLLGGPFFLWVLLAKKDRLFWV